MSPTAFKVLSNAKSNAECTLTFDPITCYLVEYNMMAFRGFTLYLYVPGGRKEGNVLFNDALNTFYLRLYGVRHMVKYHTYIERGNPVPPHGLLFPINSKGSFICTIPQTGLHIPRPLLHQS